MPSGVRLTKPWVDLTEANAAALGGRLGVFELADEVGRTVAIGYAGGGSLFGLGGELRARVGTAAMFRAEVTSAYLTRYRELLMVHLHDHGSLPEGNDDDASLLGRLSPS